MKIKTSALKRVSSLADRLTDSSVLIDIIGERPVLFRYNDIAVVDIINNSTLKVTLDMTLDESNLNCSILVNQDSPYYTFINVNLI